MDDYLIKNAENLLYEMPNPEDSELKHFFYRKDKLHSILIDINDLPFIERDYYPIEKYIINNLRNINRITEQANAKVYYEFLKHVIYIKTENGFWKVYVSNNWFYLYHRNVFLPGMPIEQLTTGTFHRQKEISGGKSLVNIIEYITKHDKSKLIIETKGCEYLPQKTKKERGYYKSAKKREKRRQVRRVYQLFDQI